MKDDALIIDFMLTRIARIHDFTQGKRELFYDSALVQSAVLRELHVLTDASKHLSDVAKKNMGEVMWREITGFRNFLVHDYLGDLNLDIVWAAIEGKLSHLMQQLNCYRSAL